MKLGMSGRRLSKEWGNLDRLPLPWWHGVGSADLELGERADVRVQHNPAMVEKVTIAPFAKNERLIILFRRCFRGDECVSRHCLVDCKQKVGRD
jgi:hypothetical protein